jgi:hypothetical protein
MRIAACYKDSLDETTTRDFFGKSSHSWHWRHWRLSVNYTADTSFLNGILCVSIEKITLISL